MKQSLKAISRSCLVAAVTLALVPGPVAAGTPNNLDDIVYQDAGWGTAQLRKRGYTLIKSDQHHGSLVQYWWNNQSNTCVRADEANGKYESIQTTSSTDCNQYHKEATDGSAVAAIAIGAAALLGIAALSHDSHQRDGKHGEDSQSVAEFDRGYRDGLHHERYHNYNNTTAYSDGYNTGQQERDEETRHRSSSGHHSGYQAYVNVNDMVGARAGSADSDMRSRGFTDTGGYKQGNRSYTTWWNQRTRQCVQLETKEGRIRNVETLYEGNCT